MVFRDRDLARVAEHEAPAASTQKAGIGAQVAINLIHWKMEDTDPSLLLVPPLRI
jgi:hypothetical protein